MKKKIVFVMLWISICAISASGCVMTDFYGEPDDGEVFSSSECSHTFGDWSVTRSATCEENGELTRVCKNCSDTETKSVARLDHTYDQKNTASKYIRTKATASEAATYYYSCRCGRYGTKYFSYGSPSVDTPSGDSGWSACNKTVYGIAKAYFYTKPSSTGVCGTSGVGYSIKVVSTNGEWYEVDKSNVYTNCTAYIKCSDVTDNADLATFYSIPEDCFPDATVKNAYKGAYLRNDISGSDASKVGLIQGSGYLTVVSMNKAQTWISVYYDGTDSEGRSYDSSKLYYCSLDEIEVVGMPESWP